MYLFAVTLLVTLASHGNCYYSKCCKSGEYLWEVDSVFRCTENKLRRLYVLTNESDFLKDNSDGECVDTSTDFYIFKIANGKIAGKRPVRDTIFPKCCPLNYSYNSMLHSCEEFPSVFDDIKENFIRVGLPNCKTIVDNELNGTIDIYQFKNHPSSESYCFDKNEKGAFVYRECKESADVCENTKCIKKCCPDGQSFINKSRCFDTFTRGLNLTSLANVEKAEEPYAIISNRICKSIYMMKEDQYIFQLDDKGVFHLWHNKSNSFIRYKIEDTKSYCIEHTKTQTMDRYLFFMCFPEQILIKKIEYTIWAKVLSCIFLVLTVMVYFILRETRNMFGKIMVNYCAASFFDNAILLYSQVNLHPSHINCLMRGFGIIFFVSAAFSWSNIICYDIYRTIGSMQVAIGPLSGSLKKLLSYLLYGWGIPAIMTLITALFYNFPILPHSVQPYLATKKCFFETIEGNYSAALFFNLPHLIIQLVNTFFFVKTTMYCLKVKNEINKVKDSLSDEKNKRFQQAKSRLFLILKLSVIMGISFLFEVVSSFFDMQSMGTTAMYIEIVWDTINCLQGVFIFIIFICKKKIYNDLMRRFKTSMPRNMSFSSLSTQATSASSRASKKFANVEGAAR